MGQDGFCISPSPNAPAMRQRKQHAKAEESAFEATVTEAGHPDASTSRTSILLLVAVAVRVCAAFSSPIPDCDGKRAAALQTEVAQLPLSPETFNYWEPTHFLMYGRGLQTWEYRLAFGWLVAMARRTPSLCSPVYALRSYTYILFHVFLGRILQLFGESSYDMRAEC